MSKEEQPHMMAFFVCGFSTVDEDLPKNKTIKKSASADENSLRGLFRPLPSKRKKTILESKSYDERCVISSQETESADGIGIKTDSNIPPGFWISPTNNKLPKKPELGDGDRNRIDRDGTFIKSDASSGSLKNNERSTSDDKTEDGEENFEYNHNGHVVPEQLEPEEEKEIEGNSQQDLNGYDASEQPGSGDGNEIFEGNSMWDRSDKVPSDNTDESGESNLKKDLNDHNASERPGSSEKSDEDDWSNMRTPPPSSRNHPFLAYITWAPKLEKSTIHLVRR